MPPPRDAAHPFPKEVPVAGPSSSRWLGVASVAAGFFAGRAAVSQGQPQFRRLTFRRGYLTSARFSPDGQTIIYCAACDGDALQLFSGPWIARSIASSTSLLTRSSLSPGRAKWHSSPGPARRCQWNVANTLHCSLAGGFPRELIKGVQAADWSPDGNQLAVVVSIGSAVSSSRLKPNSRENHGPARFA